MAQLVLTSAARAAAGLAGSFALGAVDRLFTRGEPASRLDGLAVASASEGRGLPIIYGRMRVAGQVIWASRFSEQRVETGGGKGAPSTTEYRYAISFALALCEGPVAQVGRLWADGAELDLSGVNWRLHPGDATQAPDPLIEAIEGAAPAYRGVAYLVFEDFPVTPYGDRIPNISVEVVSAPNDEPGSMERLVRGVCLIPGSGEQIYATTPIAREAGPGREVWENRHQRRAASDLEAALDDLEARLPSVRTVALVVSWFGDDLRCGTCRIRPGVETREAVTRPFVWRAGGADRRSAWLVSRVDGAPAYGGTPSDDSVREAIVALKARGFQVVFYPFVLMDVPSETDLPDPSGEGVQPAFPWRGRIRPDAAAPSQDEEIAAFFGGARAADFNVAPGDVSYSGDGDWRFNRFILHQAALAKSAGGVDAFLIGSELVALTAAPGDGSYPAAQHLAALAGEVRSLVGSGTRLSYAADWSEYAGLTPPDAPSDKRYPLDVLWGAPEIDFIGIDWYGPLSDWRDGEDHLDRAQARSSHERAYLEANVEGGEGFDWYYASATDRAAQRRTPITDPTEPWIWRFKDLRGFWSNPHHERIGGVRSQTRTPWEPRSKPVVFVEYGCPAVDKGANQPNVFLDPKSAESAAPYFSSGARDDLVQRRYVEALLGYWGAPGRNPVSDQYDGAMLDLDASCAWTWDARPFPEFPAFTEVWADGGNWRRGHWLTGRAGQSDLARIVADLCARAGLTDADVSRLEGVASGFAVDGPVPAVDVIAELGAVFGFAMVDASAGTVFLPQEGVHQHRTLHTGDLAGPEAPRVRRRAAPQSPGAVRVDFIDASREFARAQVTVRSASGDAGEAASLGAPLLADAAMAAKWGRAFLERACDADLSMRIALPPSLSALEPGDVVQLEPGQDARAWRIVELEGGLSRRAELRAIRLAASPAFAGADETARQAEAHAPASRPLTHVFEIYGEGGGVFVAAFVQPWRGPLDIWAGPSIERLTKRALIERPAVAGVLTRPLPAGDEGRWHRQLGLEVRLHDGALASRTELDVLAGRGLAALQGEAGWELVAFETAELVAPDIWRLDGLLRRLGGGPAGALAAEGAAFIRLDGAAVRLNVEAWEREAPLVVIVVPAGAALDDPSASTATITPRALGLQPLSPVHGWARRGSDGLEAVWIRRTRLGGDDWAARDAPLGEEEERYVVRVRAAGGALLAETECSEPGFSMPASALDALSEPPAFLEAAQVSRAAGEGARLRIDVLG